MNRKELPYKIWKAAWLHFGDNKALIQCGNGIHPANEKCLNCFCEARA